MRTTSSLWDRTHALRLLPRRIVFGLVLACTIVLTVPTAAAFADPQPPCGLNCNDDSKPGVRMHSHSYDPNSPEAQRTRKWLRDQSSGQNGRSRD